MAFIAQYKNTEERIDITKFASPREELNNKLFECRLCKTQMFIRRSPKGRYHFFHQRSCTADYLSHPESPEHLAGKSFVATYILPKLSEYATFSFLFEEPLQEVKRIADIVTQFPMGWWVANEIQLSSITAEKLEERRKDYLDAGVDVIWWLGKAAYTEQNRNWAVKTYGFSPFLIFEKEEVIKYGYNYQNSYVDDYGVKKKYIATHTHVIQQDEIEKSFASAHLITKIGEWWRELAFVRYFQVWEMGNKDRYQRALFANKATISSFAGKIGLRDSKFQKKKDMWCVNEVDFLLLLKERGISPLSKETISNIKEKAKKYNSKKLNKLS